MVRMLVKFRQTNLKRQELHEEAPLYAAPKFSHEKLHVYRAALRYLFWSHLLCQVHQVPAPVSSKLDAASTSILLNLAESNGKFAAKERCRFLDLSQSAALRCAST
jgi:type VI protein secretion system component VasK